MEITLEGEEEDTHTEQKQGVCCIVSCIQRSPLVAAEFDPHFIAAEKDPSNKTPRIVSIKDTHYYTTTITFGTPFCCTQGSPY